LPVLRKVVSYKKWTTSTNFATTCEKKKQGMQEEEEDGEQNSAEIVAIFLDMTKRQGIAFRGRRHGSDDGGNVRQVVKLCI
jgi:hypothetical protein